MRESNALPEWCLMLLEQLRRDAPLVLAGYQLRLAAGAHLSHAPRHAQGLRLGLPARGRDREAARAAHRGQLGAPQPAPREASLAPRGEQKRTDGALVSC